MRKSQLVESQYYHIYNRGTEKRKIFLDNFDYQRFLLSMRLMNDDKDGLMIFWRDFQKTKPSVVVDTFLKSNLREEKPLVEFVCFSLLPNHFHLILSQLEERGIERFMQRIGTGYTMYFNKKYKRSGVLFQGKFKSSHIKTNDLLLYLSVYVNCNAEVHGIANAQQYHWSSFNNFLTKKKIDSASIVRTNSKIIIDQFKNTDGYKDFAKENLKEMKQKKEDEKITFE